MLVERDELTSGSSWHAAGGMHTINGDPNVAMLQKYTIDLYPEIEAASGQSVGLHMSGGYMLAGTPERMEWLKMAHARGRYLGLDTEIVTAEEAHANMPLLDPRQFVGALWNPSDGHVDPSGTTHAYAAAARKQGAEIYRFTRVEALAPLPGGGWLVTTDKGEISAGHVVNAGGLWAREVGRMVGLELPILAMEHMYLITDDMPEVEAFNRDTGGEMLHVVDFEGEIYLRQEGRGMLMGTYEKACKPWSPISTPWDFGHELLPADLDRIAPSLEVGFEHFPAFKEAGIKRVINGPFCFAPDGNPLVGPVRGPAGLLVRLRRDGRFQPRRRGRPRACQLDRRWRPRFRHSCDGCGPFRRLGDARLHRRQGPRELFPPLLDPLPERGTAGGAAAPHDAGP